MQLWRIFLALWLIVSGIIWFFGPTFPFAFLIEGVLAIIAAVLLLIPARVQVR